MDRLVRFSNAVVSIPGQIVLFIFTSALALFMAYAITKESIPLEQRPTLKSLTPDQIRKERLNPTEVKVGLYIKNFLNFDTVTNLFEFEGDIWFSFDPTHISTSIIDSFSFFRGEIVKKSEPNTKLIGDNLLLEYKIRVKFYSQLDQQLFPLDDHLLKIILVNKKVSPTTLIYESYKSGFVLSDELDIGDWKVVERTVTAGYDEAQLEAYDQERVVRHPEVIFTLSIKRNSVRKLLLILLPLFLIFFLGLFSFAFDPEKHSRTIFSLSSSSLVAIITYRFVIQSMSPQTGYFLLSDHIFMLFLTFSFTQFILASLLVMREKLTPILSIIRAIMFVSFHIIFLLTWTYLLFFWKV